MMTVKPTWVAQMQAGFESGAAAAFVLHGNTRDYVSPGLALAQFLAAQFANRQIVAFYNPATGFRFPFPSHEAVVMQMIGSQQQQASAAFQMLGGGVQQQQALPKGVSAALDLIDTILRTQDMKTAVVIEYAERVWPAAVNGVMSPEERINLVKALEWGRKGDARELDNMLVLVSENGLDAMHEALRSASSGYKPLAIRKPDDAQREEFISVRVDEFDVTLEGLDEAQLVRTTAGLSLLQIEDLLLEAQFAGKLTPVDCKRLKNAMIEAEYGGLVEIVEPEADGLAALGGKDELKAWLREEVVAPLKDGRIDDALKGFIFAGPPGTGKTYALACLAGEVGFQMLALDAGRIQAKYVGESQERLRRVFELAQVIAPVIIFMDELDQSDMTSRGQGSGNPVAGDLFNMMLKFLGDPRNRGKVIFVGATNRPDLLDAALTRTGRIDAVVPVLLPDEKERIAVLKVQAKRQGTVMTNDAVQLASKRSEKWTGSDLEALVRKARKLAGKARRSQIGVGDVEQALAAMRPDTSKSDYFSMLAVRACTEIGLLPMALANVTYEEMDAVIDNDNGAGSRRKRSGRSL